MTNTKFIAEVAAVNENVWSGNAMEYETIEEAEKWLDGLRMKWFGYDMAHIITTDMPKRQPVDYEKDMFYQNFRNDKNKIPYNRSALAEKQLFEPEKKIKDFLKEYYSHVYRNGEYFDKWLYKMLGKYNLELDEFYAIPKEIKFEYGAKYHPKYNGETLEQWFSDGSDQPIITPSTQLPESKLPNIDAINAIDTTTYNYWFERYSAHGKGEIEEIYNKYYKQFAESPDIEEGNNRIKALIDVVKNKGIKLVSPSSKQPEPDYTIYKGTTHTYENLYQLNKAIEELLTVKVQYEIVQTNLLKRVEITENNLTSDEMVFCSTYVGYGGLQKLGATMADGSPTALLYEFYTPDEIIKVMWALAYKYGNTPSNIFEPSVATGRFFKYAPQDSVCTGYEINIFSALICKLLYPNANIFNNYFEQKFLKNNNSIKDKMYNMPKHDLVIGNPPYGDISEGGGKWFAMGEDKYSRAANYIDYFIFRGLDLLIDGGLLIYIVGAEKHSGGNLFLEKGDNRTKQLIAAKADLVDAYKLPIKLFQTTGVSSEIIVLRKK